MTFPRSLIPAITRSTISVILIDGYFRDPGATTIYEYDSGDCWLHEVLLENVFRPEEDVKYPRCICGRGACPPEDCGGPKGYLELRQILRDPKDKEYQQKVKWMSAMVKMRGQMPFDEINPGAVRFSKPRTRLKHKMKDLPSPKDDRPHPVRSQPRFTPLSTYGGTHDVSRVDPTVSPFL